MIYSCTVVAMTNTSATCDVCSTAYVSINCMRSKVNVNLVYAKSITWGILWAAVKYELTLARSALYVNGLYRHVSNMSSNSSDWQITTIVTSRILPVLLRHLLIYLAKALCGVGVQSSKAASTNSKHC